MEILERCTCFDGRLVFSGTTIICERCDGWGLVMRDRKSQAEGTG